MGYKQIMILGENKIQNPSGINSNYESITWCEKNFAAMAAKAAFNPADIAHTYPLLLVPSIATANLQKFNTAERLPHLAKGGGLSKQRCRLKKGQATMSFEFLPYSTSFLLTRVSWRSYDSEGLTSQKKHNSSTLGILVYKIYPIKVTAWTLAILTNEDQAISAVVRFLNLQLSREVQETDIIPILPLYNACPFFLFISQVKKYRISLD